MSCKCLRLTLDGNGASSERVCHLPALSRLFAFTYAARDPLVMCCMTEEREVPLNICRRRECRLGHVDVAAAAVALQNAPATVADVANCFRPVTLAKASAVRSTVEWELHSTVGNVAARAQTSSREDVRLNASSRVLHGRSALPLDLTCRPALPHLRGCSAEAPLEQAPECG